MRSYESSWAYLNFVRKWETIKSKLESNIWKYVCESDWDFGYMKK